MKKILLLAVHLYTGCIMIIFDSNPMVGYIMISVDSNLMVGWASRKRNWFYRLDILSATGDDV